jgi:5-methylcytosine-specific restriction protein A
LYYSDARKKETGIGPSQIDGFDPVLKERRLVTIGDFFYASPLIEMNTIAETISTPQKYYEGASQTISVNAYERNHQARLKCIEYYGYQCQVCSFDFEKFYGVAGRKYIHVHHVVPLSQIGSTYEVDPIKDLVPVCPNCHAIIHRTTPAMSIEVIKSLVTPK